MIYDLDSTFRPKQMDAWRMLQREDYDETGLPINNIIGYGGALGGGKSFFIDEACLQRRLLYPGSKGAIFRRLKDDVYDTHVVKMFQAHPWTEQFYSNADWEFKFPNGSRIIVGYAQFLEDMYRYKSHEFDDIFIDQAEEFEPEQLRFIRTRNRKSGVQSMQKMPKCFWSFNTDIAPAQQELKRLFDDRDNYRGGEREESYAFIRAYLWDNYQWISDIPEKFRLPIENYYILNDEQRRDFTLQYAGYANDLKSLDSDEFESAVYGKWNTGGGQYFKKWNESYHVVDPFEIPSNWRRMMAMDYGNQTAVVAGAVDEEGTIYLTNEYYSDDNTIGSRERARSIADWMVDSGLAKQYEGQIMSGKISWHVSMMADINLWYPDQSNVRRFPAQDFFDVGIHPRKVLKKKEDGMYRQICNRTFKGLLYYEVDSGNLIKAPKLKVFRGMCPEFCKTLPLLKVDPTKPDDFLQPKNAASKKDHVYDAAKYLVMNISKASDGLIPQKQIVSSRGRAGGKFAIAPPKKFSYAR